MARHTQSIFSTIKSEGALLPPDLLKRIAEGGKDLDGLAPESFHLDKSERINEAANRAWSAVKDAWQRFAKQREQIKDVDTDTGTSITRERWLLKLFEALGYGRLQPHRSLCFTQDKNVLRPVDYKNLGSEELGSVYESLLELHPDINTDAATFALSAVTGSERKTTGSYYTPSSLINCLLDSALDPVVDDRLKSKSGTEAEQALLSLKICDPACGSGHFLIAAANRVAKRLAAIRTGDTEPAPSDQRAAFRDVVSRCIYGVDINPMAVELCKVALWLESIDPGRPLSFLDHRILCGNSLIGATPRLLTEGIPDDAFKPIEGDDKTLCKEYKRRNKEERKGQQFFVFEGAQPWVKLGNMPATFARLDAMSDDSLKDIEAKAQRYAQLVGSADYESACLLADAWCAAFVWKKTKDFGDAITESVFRRIEANPHDITPWMKQEIQRLRDQYEFFHWHLAFPDVFRVPEDAALSENKDTGWDGGFDVILGNPP